jgi:hypothetical protein
MVESEIWSSSSTDYAKGSRSDFNGKRTAFNGLPLCREHPFGMNIASSLRHRKWLASVEFVDVDQFQRSGRLCS